MSYGIHMTLFAELPTMKNDLVSHTMYFSRSWVIPMTCGIDT